MIGLTAVSSNEKVYVMYNSITNVTVECTEKYLLNWLARGFEILEIKEESFDKI